MTTNGKCKPERKRAKSRPLTTPDGEELKPLDTNGEPIIEGVVTEDVRQAAEEYSLALYKKSKAVEEKKNSELVLIEEMHKAGIDRCNITDGDGNPVTFRIQSKEAVKKEKCKNGDDD